MLGCPIDRHTTDRKDAQMNEKFDTGMQVRRNVLGDAHVDRAEAGKTDFDSPFQTLITEGAWGTL